MLRSIWKRRLDAEDLGSWHASERMEFDFTHPMPKARGHHHQFRRAGERIGWDLELRLAHFYLVRGIARARGKAGFGVKRVDHIQRAVGVEKRVLVGVEPGCGVRVSDV